jgi:hypothetical protein
MGGSQEHLGKGAAPRTYTLEKKDAIFGCRGVRCEPEGVLGYL